MSFLLLFSFFIRLGFGLMYKNGNVWCGSGSRLWRNVAELLSRSGLEISSASNWPPAPSIVLSHSPNSPRIRLRPHKHSPDNDFHGDAYSSMRQRTPRTNCAGNILVLVWIGCVHAGRPVERDMFHCLAASAVPSPLASCSHWYFSSYRLIYLRFTCFIYLNFFFFGFWIIKNKITYIYSITNNLF